MIRINSVVRTAAAFGAVVAIAGTAAACSSSKSAAKPDTKPAAAASSASSATGGTAASELRLGYFANVTHATPVVGVAHGDFAKALGATKLTTQIYNAGPAEMTALLGGQLDAAYV
ncbi:MAG: ABC transporter substrate-binding protein, partial [Catenulispora sp.]|nr:ABC transporter substrate-binding protein [Catenulispora sp.]